MRIHVVGNACIDTVFRVGRFPAPGETLNAAGHIESLGGKGANQAVAAARTGASVTLWTALGRDARGDEIAAALAGELHLQAARLDSPTDRSTVIVAEDGQNFIVSGIACIEGFDPIGQTDLPRKVLAGDIVLLQGNMSATATSSCIAFAHEAGARCIVNASPITPRGVPDLAPVDLLVVNAQEAAALTATKTTPEAMDRLGRQARGAVVVTLGEDGCIVLEARGKQPLHIPARSVRAIDTSGAGDVFCGCVAGFMAQGCELVPAVRLAVAAAAIAVTRQGTLASCPSAAEMRGLAAGMEFAS